MFKLFFQKKYNEKLISLKTAKIHNNESGFFLLYAIILTSIMLIIGTGILDVTLQQIAYSGVDRESVRAFYAADAGIECGLSLDFALNKLSTSTPPGTYTPGGSETVCNASSITITTTTNPPKFTFNMWLDKASASNKSCASVTVSRVINADGTTGTTTISSLGYNSECPLIGASTRIPVTERGLMSVY